jgi:hypothetical protein
MGCAAPFTEALLVYMVSGPHLAYEEVGVTMSSDDGCRKTTVT